MTENLILPLLVLLPMIFAATVRIADIRSGRAAEYTALFAVSAEFVLAILFLICGGAGTEYSSGSFCLMGVSFGFDGFKMVYGVITASAWLLVSLFSKQYFEKSENRARYWSFSLLTLGASMGIFLAEDLYTLFIFFEIMSFASFVMVIHEESDRSIRAANTYLAFAVAGGLMSLMGISLLQHALGTLRIAELYGAAQAFSALGGGRGVLYTAAVCLLIGFGIKAGMFPLHMWLPVTYTAAPAPTTALLSGILSKTGVLGIIVVSCDIFKNDTAWGSLVLTLGAITMAAGAVFALVSSNLKRTLAFSSMSQIGFILVGVGMSCFAGGEAALAARGIVLHMVNHSVFKLLLFMAAGVVFLNMNSFSLNAVKGFGRGKPLFHFAFLMGALGISGVPLWSGYVSKTLLHESIVEYIGYLHRMGAPAFSFQLVEWLFLISGGITLAYMTKLYVVLFVERPARKEAGPGKTSYMSPLTAVSLCCAAAVSPILGLLPGITMDPVADKAAEVVTDETLGHAMHYFSLTNLSGAGISIAIGALVYIVVVRKLLIKKDKTGNILYIDPLQSRFNYADSVKKPYFLSWLPDALGAHKPYILRWLSQATGILMLGFSDSFLFRFLGNKALSGRFASVIGDNRVLRPFSKAFLKLVDAVACFASDSLDACILFLRSTVFKELKLKEPGGEESVIAARAGSFLDSIMKDGYGGRSYREFFISADLTVRRVSKRIRRNLSFSLLMSTIGVCVFFIYLLITVL